MPLRRSPVGYSICTYRQRAQALEPLEKIEGADRVKVLQARHIKNAVIHLEFSDGSCGDYDFSDILARDTALTRPLRASKKYFRRIYIELGALGWPNGPEFSAGSLRTELKKEGCLIERKAASGRLFVVRTKCIRPKVMHFSNTPIRNCNRQR